ncbi:MAG: twin-arginine translocase TatA/TatE family subunit [Pseudobdellovibrionaceae bacterium]
MSPSLFQILIVVVLVMLLFGAGKLPRIMGDMAEGIKSFKRGMKDEEADKKSSSASAKDE